MKTLLKIVKVIGLSLAALVITVIVAGVVYGLYNLLSYRGSQAKDNDLKATVSVEQIDNETTGKLFGDTDEISLKQVLQVMHHMSHQKVEAGQKWGHTPMTEENIKQVKAVVVASDFENKEKLLKILKKWEDGDFSKADDDHNEIWKIQGGTVGKATGVMSKDEERAYIEEMYSGETRQELLKQVDEE